MRIKPAGRLLAFVLTLSLLLGMVPTALADEILPPEPTESTEESVPPTVETAPSEETPPTEGTPAPEEAPPADNSQAAPAAESAPILLSNGVSLTAGVSGYINNSPWLYTEPKQLVLNVANKPKGPEYKVQITIAQGMRLNAFIWGEDKTGIPTANRGTPQTSALIQDNNISAYEYTIDDTTGIATLTYTIASDTTAISISGVTVRPDEYYTYDGDQIPNAVTIKLLDSNGDLLADSPATQVTVNFPVSPGGTTLNPSDLVENTIFEGYTFPIFTFETGGVRGQTYVKELILTLPMPKVVTDVTRVNGFKDTQIQFDKEKNILTITNTGELIASGRSLYSVMNIKAAPAKTYEAAAKPSYRWVTYDNTVLEGTFGTPAKITTVKADDKLKISPDTNSYAGGNPTAPDGVTNLIATVTFSTNTKLDTDQTIRYDFSPKDGLGVDIVRADFPIQIASALRGVKVTFDDGSDFKIDRVEKANDYDNHVAVTMDSLRNEWGYAGVGKYIRTITANCGTFEANYRNSISTIFAGRFSQGVVDTYSGSGRLEVPYSISCGGETKPYTLQYWNNKISTLYMDVSVDPTTKIIKAGETVKVNCGTSFHYSGLSWDSTSTFYIINRDGFGLDLSSVELYRARNVNNILGGAKLDPSEYEIEETQVTDQAGVSYPAYRIYVPDSVVSSFTPGGSFIDENKDNYMDSGYDKKNGGYNLIIKFNLLADESLKTGQYSLENIFLLTNGSQTALNGVSRYRDVYDLNGNQDYADRIAAYPSGLIINVTESPNLYLKQWLTEPDGTAETPPYDRGMSGTTDTNAVPFAPRASADLHIQLRNTITDPASTNTLAAYIPIPKTTVKDGAMKPQNILDKDDNLNKDYQFDNFQWNMNLKSLVVNPNPNLYDIVYYTGQIRTDENGVPVADTPSVTNPRAETELTDKGGLAAVSMVTIKVQDGKSIPLKNGSVSYSEEFIIPLTVGTTEDEANNFNLNGKKNIFRPNYYRSSTSATGWTKGNYVAPLLSAAIIEGVVFDDLNHDGLHNDGEPRQNVTVHLTSTDGTVSEERKTAEDGKYKFSGLQPGDYTVTVTNPAQGPATDSTARHFTTPSTNDRNFTIDSDGVPNADHSEAGVTVTIPATKNNKPATYNSYIGFGLVPPAKVTFERASTVAGDIIANGEQTIWPGETVTAPSLTTNSGYVFEKYTVDNQTVNLSTHRFYAPATVKVHWKAQEQNLTLDANGGKYGSAATTKTIQVPTGTSLKSYLEDPQHRPTKEGYEFVAWKADAAGTQPAATAMPVGGLTVYAEWRPIEVTLTFNAQGGIFASGSSATMKRPADSTFTPPTVYKTDNSTFLGWYTDTNIESTRLPDQNAKAPLKDTEYYAKWAGYNVSGRVFLDRNYNGVYTAGNTQDIGLAGVTVQLLDNGGNVAATATTDDNGAYILNAKAAGSYYLKTGLTLSGSSAKLIEKSAVSGGSCLDPATGQSDTITVSDGGVTGKSIGYAEPISFKLYSDAKRTQEVTDATRLDLQVGKTTKLYYTVSPDYLSWTAPDRIPSVDGGAYVAAVDETYGTIELQGKALGTDPTALTAKMDDGFKTDVTRPFQVRVLPPQVVVTFDNNLDLYAGVEYQKSELFGGIDYENRFVGTEDILPNDIQARKVYRYNPDGTLDRTNEMAWGAMGETKTFADGEVGKYALVYEGTDKYGRNVINGTVVGGQDSGEIVRTVYIHGYPTLNHTAPIQARLSPDYDYLLEQDGQTYITATHRHVYDTDSGGVEIAERETFSTDPNDKKITLVGFYRYGTSSDDAANGKLNTVKWTDQKVQDNLRSTPPTEPGAYEVFYAVWMEVRQMYLTVGRTIYLHGSPSLSVNGLISIPAKVDGSGGYTNDPMDLDDAAKAIWESNMLKMDDLVHVREDGSTVAYSRKNTQLYKKDGALAGDTAAAIGGWTVIAAPTEWITDTNGTKVGYGPDGGTKRPANIFLHKDSLNVLENKPGTYDIIMVFQDNLDGMGSPGTKGEWNENWEYLYKEGGTGAYELKIRVQVTGTDNKPVLPAQATINTNFVKGDSTWFSELTAFQNKTVEQIKNDPALSGAAKELEKRITSGQVTQMKYENWIRYYQAEKDQVTTTVTGNSDPWANKTGRDLLYMLNQAIRYNIHDADIHNNIKVSQGGLDDTKAKALHDAAVTLLWKSVKVDKITVPLNDEQNRVETITDLSNEKLLKALDSLEAGAIDITFSVGDVKVEIDNKVSADQAVTVEDAKQNNTVLGYGYKLTLDTTTRVTETYKIYVHSDLKFERPNGEPLVTYGLHLFDTGIHAAMQLNAYYIDGQRLQKKSGVTVSNTPNIEQAGTYINMDYKYTHPVKGVLPTLRERTVHYYGRAFVNDQVTLDFGSDQPPNSGIVYLLVGDSVELDRVLGKVNKWVNLPPDTGLKGESKAYPPVNVNSAPNLSDDQKKEQNIVDAGGAMYKQAQLVPVDVYVNQIPNRGRLSPSYPSSYAVTYEAEDKGPDENHPYHNKKNQISLSLTYVFDGRPEFSFANNAGVQETKHRDENNGRLRVYEYEAEVVESITEDQLKKLLDIRAAVSYGGLPPTALPVDLVSFTKNLDSGTAKAIFQTQAAPGRQENEARAEISFKLLKAPVIRIKLEDTDGKPIGSDVTYTDAVIGQPYTVRAPHVDGYTLNGDSVRQIDTVQEGDNNKVTFTYKKIPPDANLADYTVIYKLEDGTVLYSDLRKDVVDKEVEHKALDYFYADGHRYALVLADGEQNTKKIKLKKPGKNEITFTYKLSDIPTGGGGGGGGTTTVTNYALTFEVNGGSAIQAVTEQSGKTVKLDAYKPTRKGYTFTGWFSDSALKKPITEIKLDGNKVVYAGWEKSDEIPNTGVTGGTSISDSLITDDHFAYVQGSEGSFTPNRNMTRAEAAMIFYRLLKDKDVPVTADFSDVPAGEWYAQAVNTLASLNVITGYTDGTFKPGGTITRAEFVTIATRFVGLTDENPSFTDVPSDYWAYHYIATAVSLGWVDGYPDGSFQPTKTITRSEAVKIVNRMLGRQPDQAAIDKLDPPYVDLDKDNWAYYEILEASVAHEFELDKQKKEIWTKQK